MPKTRTTQAIQAARGTGVAYSDSLYGIASQNMEADYESKLYDIKRAERDTMFNAAIKTTSLLGEIALSTQSKQAHEMNIDALGKEEYQKALKSGEPILDKYGMNISESYYDVKTGKEIIDRSGKVPMIRHMEQKDISWDKLTDRHKDLFRPKRTTADVSFWELFTGTGDNRDLKQRFKGFVENVGTYAGIEPQYEWKGEPFDMSDLSARGKRASARLAGFKDDDPISNMQSSAKKIANQMTTTPTTNVNINTSKSSLNKPFDPTQGNTQDWIFGSGPQPQWVTDLMEED